MATPEAIATREAYGKALEEAGATHPEVVVLDADLSKSTMTCHFAKRFPDRFFQMGIAESNMVCVAAGLATCGKKPFVSSFAIFASRAWEQIRNTVARGGIPVAFCLSHAGITVGEDGASAQACEDIAIMRAIPGMNVIVPCDGPETSSVIQYLAEHLDCPTYVRLSRSKTPVIHRQSKPFQPGKADILREGDHLTYIACGLMVSKALEAAETLQKDGVSAGVINMASIKPLDEQAVIAAARRGRGIVTLEEHSIIGGLGEAVAAVVSEHCPTKVLRIGIEDIFGESGKPDELVEKYGLSSAAVAEKTRRFLSA